VAEKKVGDSSLPEKRGLIDMNNTVIPITRQCELVGLNRSSFYYKPVPVSDGNLHLMVLIDRLYTKDPSSGVPRMTKYLRRLGYRVNRKRISRLMRLMGLQGIAPKKGLSWPNKEHPVYPYLLKGLDIVRPNQVFCSDITYIPMRKGFIYLTAVMDWYSRYVVSWKVSLTLDAAFCVEALEEAFTVGTPDIFNTDQGSQFTSRDFTTVLKNHHIAISMDGKGRVFDNIFIERLWRTVKYEEVYLKDYANVREAIRGLADFFRRYNEERPHSALGDKTPYEVYHGVTAPQPLLQTEEGIHLKRAS
jgi:putative transposase